MNYIESLIKSNKVFVLINPFFNYLQIRCRKRPIDDDKLQFRFGYVQNSLFEIYTCLLLLIAFAVNVIVRINIILQTDQPISVANKIFDKGKLNKALFREDKLFAIGVGRCH